MSDARAEYGDIIDMPHHQSEKRAHMSLRDRAAQFAPFAALRGYDEEIRETARLTDERIELSSEEISKINDKLNEVIKNIKAQPEVEITFFAPDGKKQGGAYVTMFGNIRRVDDVEKNIYFTNGFRLPIKDLYEINIIE